MGLLNPFHLIWLAGQTTLSVRRGTPTCEVGYQFGTDDIFKWLHQVTDAWCGCDQGSCPLVKTAKDV